MQKISILLAPVEVPPQELEIEEEVATPEKSKRWLEATKKAPRKRRLILGSSATFLTLKIIY